MPLEGVESFDDMDEVIRIHPIVEWYRHAIPITIARAGEVVRLETKAISIIPKHMHGVRPWPSGDASLL